MSSKTTSGTSTHKIELPDPLPYPKLYDFSDLKQLENVFCYVLEAYPRSGVGVVVIRDSGDVAIRLCDFNGVLIDVENPGSLGPIIEEIMTDHIRNALSIISAIQIPKCVLYFSCADIVRLIDVRWDINKYCGPGWLNDFFGKRLPIQKQIGKPMILDDENRKKVVDGLGDYSGDIILKPSKFKLIEKEGSLLPMYGVIRREAKSVT